MAVMTERDRKKAAKKSALRIGGIITIVLMYLCGYAGGIMQDEHLETGQAMIMTMERISTFHLFFPLNQLAFTGMLLAICIGAFVIFYMHNTALKNFSYNPDKLYGDAGFRGEEDRKQYDERYVDHGKYIDPITKKPVETADPNMIASNDTKLSINDRKTFRNNNFLILGGAGTGKSRFVIKPNLLQENCSYVVTDPSGEIIVSCGKVLSDHGYKIKIFNLSNMGHSNTYNPFNYIRDEAGVLMVIDCLIKNTTGKNEKGDQFFTNSEKLLYSACIFYLIDFETDESRKNFSSVMDMINMSQVDENNPSSKSELDLMFEQIDQTSLAAKYYKAFKQAAGKTLKSIIISCVVRLQSFMTPQVTRLTGSDNINLASIGDEKTILFIITPQADRTFAFLASMLYSQLFETLYHKGETQKLKTGSERLTYHVRCLMDEFANIGEIPEFPSKLSTMRKYNISATIVLQDNSQLQSMYKDEWRTIMANCDSTIFLGNAEPDTLKYFCEKLGNETVTAQSRGRSYGSKSGSSQNYQQVKRETLTAEEIGRLPNDECLVFLRGERPARDKKFKYETHKNYDLTGDAHSENNYAYDSMLIYDNQSLKGFSSIAAAKVASMEEDISEAKSAEDVFDIDPNYLLDNTYFSEVEEEQNFLLLSQECIMQIEMSSDDVQIIRFASERNVAPRILPDLVESVKVETGLEKLIIIANNGGKDTYCCGTENLCTIMDSEYVKEKKTMGNTIRTMVSTDNIDEYVEEIREVQAA
jgi:type IV secretory pathway TraG/TraD family ATPase VirD4